MLDKIIHGCQKFEGMVSLLGKLSGWLIIPMLFTVVMSITASLVGWNSFATWDMDVFLFGSSITVNSLLDLQWHMFLVIVMLGGAYSLVENSHVSVDLFYGNFSLRGKILITIFGDLLFLMPFCSIMCWFSWDFAASAYSSGEGSSYGGLLDRWFVKAFLPLGFALIALVGVSRVMRLTCELVHNKKTGSKVIANGY